MELSVYEYLTQNYENRFPQHKRPVTADQFAASSLNDSPNSLTSEPERFDDVRFGRSSSSHKKLRTNSNTVISRPVENLDSSANSSSFGSKENLNCRPTSNRNDSTSPPTTFRSSLDQLTSQLTQFSQPANRLHSAAIKMLNGGMMLPNNLINGSQTMNGDVGNASAFSPNNLTGNGNSSNNTISGLSPSSSYDSYSPDPRCKEEMSPSSMDCSLDQKKKKGPMPRQQEELCLVCADRASGYHYNALTCEGCKGFFRRSITKNAVYQCKYGNMCEIDMFMRRKCQECRLKKCLVVGMRPECVVPEYQCAIKRENKRAQRDLNKPNSTTKELNNILSVSQETSLSISNKTPELSPQQLETVQKLVFFQEEYESPPEEEVRKITPFTLGETEEDGLKRFKHMTEMTILTVQLIVEFSKKVPGFDTLLREDQITLLKACSSEVMMLRCSRKYDIKTDSILYANNQPYTRENYKSASVDQSADQLFNFCKNMCILKVDNAEYALITAIVIFSERPNLIEPKKVERIQDYYVNILKTYVESKRQPGKCYFAKLLAILTELRTLGNINNEMCVSLKVKNKKLPPFLNELWDLSDS